MDKFLTRFTVLTIAIYFIVSYIAAQFFCVDILRYSYILLLEACVVAYTFSSGKYHCKFIRWTALSILVCDIISHTDYYFDYIAAEWYNSIMLLITISGLSCSAYLAIRHFVRVRKVKRLKNGTLAN